MSDQYRFGLAVLWFAVFVSFVVIGGISTWAVGALVISSVWLASRRQR